MSDSATLPSVATTSWDSSVLTVQLAGEGKIDFKLRCTDIPPSLLGRSLELRFGPRIVMVLRMPSQPAEEELFFGPTQLPMDSLRDQHDFTIALIDQDDPDRPPVIPGRSEGAVLEAVTLPTTAAFFEKAQLHHSRYTSKAMLALAARAAYPRFAEFQPRAAALTILAHRYLERDLKGFTANDVAAMQWISGEAAKMVREGAGIIAGEAPRFDMVRWTVSLATVGGLLALCRDDLEEARFFFGTSSAQMHLVARAPVTALNLTIGCLLHGLLSAMAGEMDAARASLEKALTSYPQIVAAQDMLTNIWVVGDLINVAHVARMAFVALGRLHMLREKKVPMLNDTDGLSLAGLQMPVGRIMAAGLCPRFSAGVQEIGARPIQKPKV
jgi:hypothetical protein